MLWYGGKKSVVFLLPIFKKKRWETLIYVIFLSCFSLSAVRRRMKNIKKQIEDISIKKLFINNINFGCFHMRNDGLDFSFVSFFKLSDKWKQSCFFSEWFLVHFEDCVFWWLRMVELLIFISRNIKIGAAFDGNC